MLGGGRDVKSFIYNGGGLLILFALAMNTINMFVLIQKIKLTGKKKQYAIKIDKIQGEINDVQGRITEDNGILQEQLKRIKDIEQYIPEIKMDIDDAENRVNWFKRIQAM